MDTTILVVGIVVFILIIWALQSRKISRSHRDSYHSTSSHMDHYGDPHDHLDDHDSEGGFLGGLFDSSDDGDGGGGGDSDGGDGGE